MTEDGEILRFYQYDAFGNEKDPDGADTNYFRYCGQYFDIESGTYYLRARYYNPGNGRFTQQDGWMYGDINDPLSLNFKLSPLSRHKFQIYHDTSYFEFSKRNGA